MKLRNKKTGEIVEYDCFCLHKLKSDGCEDFEPNTKTLTELNEEWEDYEEPKPQVLYYIDRDGKIVPYKNTQYPSRVFNTKLNREIGNYFETKEEAEKAVEKLKAWKRLKDKGFKFCGMGGLVNEIYFEANAPFTHIMVDEYTADKTEKEYIDDLMLLFGGEE